MSSTERGTMDVPDPAGRGRTLATIGAAVATAGLVVLAAAEFFLSSFLVMGSDACYEQDEPLICTPGGQQLVFWLAVSGAVVGLGVAVGGAWIWPRRWRAAWIGLGYLVVLSTFGAAYMIATGNS
ncbi:hypothetical protein [Plantactinospora sp. GCM10030261]|uniref:hypothetical protein n=1 Tax=Plantactinospora sp. GCM10030261 TaxID=3273420 RepID=UPI00361B8470